MLVLCGEEDRADQGTLKGPSRVGSCEVSLESKGGKVEGVVFTDRACGERSGDLGVEYGPNLGDLGGAQAVGVRRPNAPVGGGCEAQLGPSLRGLGGPFTTCFIHVPNVVRIEREARGLRAEPSR